MGKVLNAASALKTVFVKDVNGPYQQVNNEEIYQQPLAVSNGFRSGPRNFLIDTASVVQADGSRKYPLDIRLNTYSSVQSNSARPEPLPGPLVSSFSMEEASTKQLPKQSSVSLLELEALTHQEKSSLVPVLTPLPNSSN